MKGKCVTISESGMRFGPYADGQVFHIEKSDSYNAIKQGVKMAEFLLLRKTEKNGLLLQVVEAKQSSPNPTEPSPEAQSKFKDFIEEIREKLVNALSLGWALYLEKHPKANKDLPKPFKKSDLLKSNVLFVLVIKDHEDEWLVPIRNAMAEALHPTVKTWGLGSPAIVVLNEKMAKEQQLIVE